VTDILTRLTAAIDEADAGTDALCQEYLAEAMESVRDLLDGSNGGYVAPQNRGTASRMVVGPVQLSTSRVFVQEWNQAIGRSMQQVADSLRRAMTNTQDDFEEQA
jgi:hypothetical protein